MLIHLTVFTRNNLLTLFLLPFLAITASGQDITFDFISKDWVSFKNPYQYSIRAVVLNDHELMHDAVLQPEELRSFKYDYQGYDEGKFRYYFIYDHSAFLTDLQRVLATLDTTLGDDPLDNQWKQLYLGNSIDKSINDTLATIMSKYEEIISDNTQEIKWDSIMTSTYTNFTIEKGKLDYEEINMTSSGLLIDTIVEYLSDNDCKHCRDWMTYYLSIREIAPIYTGYISSTDPDFPSKKVIRVYKYASYFFSFPFRQSLQESILNFNRDLQPKTPIIAMPYKSRLPFKIGCIFRESDRRDPWPRDVGFFLSYEETGLFENTDQEFFEYVRQNTAVRYKIFSVGYRGTPVVTNWFLLDLKFGFAYLRQQRFTIDSSTNAVSRISGTGKFGLPLGARLEIRTQLPISFYCSHDLSIFWGNFGRDDQLGLALQNLSVGVRLKILEGRYPAKP